MVLPGSRCLHLILGTSFRPVRAPRREFCQPHNGAVVRRRVVAGTRAKYALFGLKVMVVPGDTMRGGSCLLLWRFLPLCGMVGALFTLHFAQQQFQFSTDLPACVWLVSSNAGLGSQLLHVVRSKVHTPRLVWDFSNSAYGCGDSPEARWRSLFSSLQPGNHSGAPPPGCARMSINDITRLNRLAVRRHPFDARRRLCHALGEVWKPSTIMQARMDSVAAMLEASRHPVIVLQARGGDKIHGDYPEDEEYDASILPRLQEVAKHGYCNGTCFVVGEDYELGRRIGFAARRILACDVRLLLKANYSHWQIAFNNESAAFRCDSSKAVLRDIEALTLADASVGLARSNVFRVALVRRACSGRFRSKVNTFDWDGRNMRDDLLLDE